MSTIWSHSLYSSNKFFYELLLKFCPIFFNKIQLSASFSEAFSSFKVFSFRCHSPRKTENTFRILTQIIQLPFGFLSRSSSNNFLSLISYALAPDLSFGGNLHSSLNAAFFLATALFASTLHHHICHIILCTHFVTYL